MPTGNVNITSQADANAYALSYSSCDTLLGDLTISGFGVNDLSAFSGLDVILGDVNINNLYPGPFDLDGFSSLDRIDGNLTIENNSRLQSLNGLGSLDRVGGDLYVAGCDSIRDAYGLASLSVIAGKLQFFGLTDFAPDGLTQLDTVYGDCVLPYNDFSSLSTLPNDLDMVGGKLSTSSVNATSMSGANSLTRVGSLSLSSGGPMLQNINAFSALEVVDSVLTISHNDQLTSITGFGALDSVGHFLRIGNNELLTSVTGFTNVSYINGIQLWFNDVLNSISAFDHAIGIPDHVQINNNPMLSVCHVQAVCDHIASNLSTGIYLNDTDCDSPATVFSFCLPTAMQDVITQPEISVFPNPAQGRLTIVAPAGTWAHTLVDALGRQAAWSFSGVDGTHLDLQGVDPGVYSLISESNASTSVLQVVVN